MVARQKISNDSKFFPGWLAITANAQNTLTESSVTEALRRHTSGDWGELCREDASSNARALRYGGRLMSVYSQGEIRFWVITEADRSVTTVLLPLDY